MAEVIKQTRALTINPLKASQPMGAVLAFLGLRAAVPLLHGAQGCAAFTKVYYVRHFREPIPLQTTAIETLSTILGADENLSEALATICRKSRPEVVGVATTGLAETQGADIPRVVRAFRDTHPEFADVAVVPVATPDYVVVLESGFARALEAIIETLVPFQRRSGPNENRVNVLVSAMHTPGDVEAIRAWIEAFGLGATILPDLGDSLDGHLIDAETTPLTLGGTPVAAVKQMGSALATLAIGSSVFPAARKLQERTGVPALMFPHLMGLKACDALTLALTRLTGHPVPAALERQRAQLQDAMVDTHFMTGFVRVALALEPDQLRAFAEFLTAMGAEIVAAVTTEPRTWLSELPCTRVIVGDLADLEDAALTEKAQLLITNSHGVAVAERLGIPILRAGYPQYDWLGAQARQWVGYRGARQALFDLANLMLARHHGVQPYRSIYRHPEAFTAHPGEHHANTRGFCQQ